MPTFTQHKRIIMGRFGAPHGVKGAVKVHSCSTPVDNIFSYHPWHIETKRGWKEVTPSLLSNGNHLIVKVEGIENREDVTALTNKDIYIDRAQMPKLASGQYYWSDLAGMNVMTECEKLLGTVAYVFNTGANDILAIKGEHDECMLPFIPDTVVNVDMPNNTILVNWDSNF